MIRSFHLFLMLLACFFCHAEDGYRLWLRYDKIGNTQILKQYQTHLHSFTFIGSSATLIAAKKELTTGLSGMLGKAVVEKQLAGSSIVIGKINEPAIKAAFSNKVPVNLGSEGFAIYTTDTKTVVITANTDVAILYGVFHFLRLLQTLQSIQQLTITSVPKIQNRILNHWDNLNRHVERGYAGISIWNWHTLPDYIDQRYIDYARANASVGINGTVLTNVNANALVLTKDYLLKVKALADVFRPYGIKVYLTARFSAPIELGGLKTADPLDAGVKEWWKKKADEIYALIPDFGGFLVKANSEGQPGPQNYGRNHADGANMLADAVAPHNGIVMWRAFVYSNETPEDRFKQAYNEFKPLDGKFRKNVLVQVKNGPIDFQPREPFSPLFGAMPQTPLMMEFQITQEYLGQATNLVYEAPMFKEVLDADTWQKGKGSSIAKVVDGSLHNYSITGIAGVANIGNDRNWTGHPFGQANWYSFGRLAWDYDLTSTQIADEWIKQTFTGSKKFVDTARKIMLSSHQTLVNYMTPLGLHHIMGTGHHYGPAPWIINAGRADWNPVYYHRADSIGIGFDRTIKGSNALAQYAPEVRKSFEDITTCPEDYLLWFHHVPWNYKMRSGRNLWDELCYRYYSGVDSIRAVQQQWNGLKGLVDDERFTQVQMLLNVQVKEAIWWRNSCLLYFQTFSKMPIHSQYEKPDQTLEYYKGLKFPFAPGN
ncbi:MAG: alpha-glucuronidase [Flavisolibacter sp.]|nr:alpha-glucuronidase [Flavisolibacter sp.]